MSDPRLPLKTSPVPGGFAIANGGQHIYVYGREPHVASSAGTLSIDKAKAFAQEIARALTAAWDGDAE